MMFKNKVKIVFFGTVLTASPFLVYAISGGAPRRGEVREARQDIRDERQVLRQNAEKQREAMYDEFRVKREEFRDNARERIDALKQKFGEVRAKRIEDFFENMVGKFENTLDRLNSLADRIDAHLAKLTGVGKGTSQLEEKLELARGKMKDAELALTDAKTKFNAMSSSTDPKQEFKDVKVLVQEVAKKIKEAHAALVDVINSIKGASGTATTTETQ